jgi:hypothetical protein
VNASRLDGSAPVGCPFQEAPEFLLGPLLCERGEPEFLNQRA